MARLCIVALAALCSLAATAYGGWTDLTPSSNTLIVYVSSVDGNDLTGGTYSAAQVGDPFNPSISIQPFRTIAAGLDKLRNGHPDWLLLKRGNTWIDTGDFIELNKSGLSNTERILISAYGQGDRPRILTLNSGFEAYDDNISNVSLVSLHLEKDGVSGNGNGNGIRVALTNGANWLVEDCLIEKFGMNVVFETFPAFAVPIHNVAVRRSVIVDSTPPIGHHSSGLYAWNVHGLLVEECVFDFNGWDGQTQTIFNHNVYITHTCTDVVFRLNISANGSSHGCQQRPGGLNEYNVYLRNAIGLVFGHHQSPWPEYQPSGTVRNNVFMYGRDIGTEARGMGLWLQNLKDVLVCGNILSQQDLGTDPQAIKLDYNLVDVTITNNIVYRWEYLSPNDVNLGWCMVSCLDPNDIANNVVISGNDFQQPISGRLISHKAPMFTYSGNRYHSTEAEPFEHAAACNQNAPPDDCNEWFTFTGVSGSQCVSASYPVEPDRNIETYMASLNLTQTLEAFLAEARQQSKTYWRDEFTAGSVYRYVRDGFGLAPCQ
jgi:hypothetical protein